MLTVWVIGRSPFVLIVLHTCVSKSLSHALSSLLSFCVGFTPHALAQTHSSCPLEKKLSLYIITFMILIIVVIKANRELPTHPNISSFSNNFYEHVLNVHLQKFYSYLHCSNACPLDESFFSPSWTSYKSMWARNNIQSGILVFQ